MHTFFSDSFAATPKGFRPKAQGCATRYPGTAPFMTQPHRGCVSAAGDLSQLGRNPGRVVSPSSQPRVARASQSWALGRNPFGVAEEAIVPRLLTGACRARCSAFTLLEMLLVVFILGMVATSMVIFVDERGHQARYDETKRRYEQVREAIFGPEGLTINGSPVLRGYLADTGELPKELRHLWVCPKEWRKDPNDPASPPKPFQRIGHGVIQDPDLPKFIQIQHGWRGPYINTFSSATDITAEDVAAADDDFRDGWGNKFEFQKYLRPGDTDGPQALSLQSLGRDAAEGGAGNEEYAQDFPKVGTIETTTYDVAGANIPPIRFTPVPTSERVLGIIYAGFDMTEEYSDTHVSIVKTITPKDLEEWNDSIPAGLSFKRAFSDSTESPVARFPRQYQLVLYDKSMSGERFADKLVAVYPVVFTFLPKTTFVAPVLPPWKLN